MVALSIKGLVMVVERVLTVAYNELLEGIKEKRSRSSFLFVIFLML